jgi:hypothetical protein
VGSMPSPRIIFDSGLRAARTCWQTLSPLVHFLVFLSLVPGILVVHAGLERAFGDLTLSKVRSGLLVAALGMTWLSMAVILVELIPLSVKQKNADGDPNEPSWPRLPQKYQAWEGIFPPGELTLIEIVVFQGIVIVLYALMLDDGIRFRGCLYSYLLYLVGPIVFFARRGLALTKLDLIYLKWAWVPFITFGVPLYVSLSKGKWPIT